MKVKVIAIMVGALGTIELVKEQEDLEIRRLKKTI